MNTIAAWKCWSVKEFIGQCNWDKSIAPSADSRARLQNALTAWRCLRAADFFSLNNWSGTAIYADREGELNKPQVAFSLTLPTGQIWQCFNWSGESDEINSSNSTLDAIDEAIQDTEEAIAAVEEFTLNDLSQLF